MEEFNLLKKLERVKAPPDFEQKVLAQLSLRKRQVKVRHLRVSLAGAFSAIIILFVVINLFILPGKTPISFIKQEKGISASSQDRELTRQREFIPIIESVDYRREIQSNSREPSTIYILEQVSDETSAEIRY